MAFSNELVLVSLLATLQGIVAVSELTTTSAKSCKTADDCPEDEGCIGVGVVNGKNRLVRCKKFNCVHISSSHVGSFKYWLPELRFYCCAKGFVERSICNFDCPHVSAYAVGSFKIKIKNWLVERSICEFNTTNAVALTNISESTTTNAKSCKTSADCPEGEGCIGFDVVNGENRLVRCKKFNCVHVSASDPGSFRYWLPETRAYCCAKGFVERSICEFDTTNAVALTTTTSATIAPVASNTTLKAIAKNRTSSLRPGKSTSSTPTGDVDPCRKKRQQSSAHDKKFLLLGTFVVKGLSPELEKKFENIFLEIVLHCPVLHLSCNFFDKTDNIVCGYELQYATRDFADIQLRFLSSVDFRSTINSRLLEEESGEKTLEVLQHAPPSSIYEIDPEATGGLSSTVLIVVGIVSTVFGVFFIGVLIFLIVCAIHVRGKVKRERESAIIGTGSNVYEYSYET